MSSILPTQIKAPVVSQTGLGYNYVRCQKNGEDSTVYIHQLCAIVAGADPHEVFGNTHDVHHKVSIPTEWGVSQIDVPSNVELVPRWDHRRAHLEGNESEPWPPNR